ncbi:MAG TPA: EAL domain-containing protein [Armatimonadota bacterium]
MMKRDCSTTLDRILGQGALQTYFQPLVSIKTRSIIGVEALARGVTNDRLRSPEQLFHQAAREGCTLALDRLCREHALASFASLPCPAGTLLFLNFDTEIIDQGIVGSDFLLQQVQHHGLPTQQVVIEIMESKVRDVAALRRFVESYRDYGFLIALDDIGTGHSNLDRIPMLKPDILKIDRSLIQQIDQEYYQQVVFKSLVNMAKDLGVLVVAEGIETEGEAVTTLQLGADLLQGFYFAYPHAPPCADVPETHRRIAQIAARYRDHMIDHVRTIKSRHQYYDTLLTAIVQELARVHDGRYDGVLRELITRYPALECVYVLDSAGMQISETVAHAAAIPRQGTPIFRPARPGTDHSLKEYFYLLVNTSIEKFTTDPYISLASGERCITISAIFYDGAGALRVLCVDVNPE